MSYPAYSDYKQAHSIWVDEIPEGWEFVELKRCSGVKGGYAFSSDSFVDSGTPVIRIGDIKTDGTVSLEACKYIENQDDLSFRQYEIERGSLLMAMTGATIGKAGWYEGENRALLNQRVGSFNFEKDKVNKRFFWYVLNSQGYQNYIRLTAFGGAQPNISDSRMVGYHSAFPPVEEQTQIANFLDRETAKIDTLIEKQQQLIKLLQEKRQAVISHAVTKGLNPKAKMKDSGVEWLGDVPEHWIVTPLKYLVSAPIIDGPHVSPTKQDSGVPFVSAEAISGGRVNFEKKWGYISKEDHEVYSKRYKPKRGDILMVKLGATTGAVAYVDTDEDFNVWVPLATVRISEKLPSKYFFYLFQSSQIRKAIELGWTYGTQQTLGLGTLANFRLPTPTAKECFAIIHELESKIPKYDCLIEKAKTSIELMKERRTALISAAVTGKIDVRLHA